MKKFLMSFLWFLAALLFVGSTWLVPKENEIWVSTLWLVSALLAICGIVVLVDRTAFRTDLAQALITFMSVFAGAYVATGFNAWDRDKHDRVTALQGISQARGEIAYAWSGYKDLLSSLKELNDTQSLSPHDENLRPIEIGFYRNP